jgi:hypothetical protein
MAKTIQRTDPIKVMAGLLQLKLTGARYACHFKNKNKNKKRMLKKQVLIALSSMYVPRRKNPTRIKSGVHKSPSCQYINCANVTGYS